MAEELDPKIDQAINQLLRDKLHIQSQTEQLLNSLCKQFNSPDPFSQLSKMFAQKNKKIQSLTAQNKKLLLQIRSLEQKNRSQLNLSYSPQMIQGGRGDQHRVPNQKMCQSLIQKGSHQASNTWTLHETQISYDSQMQKQRLKQVSEMVEVARQEDQAYSKYNDSFLLHLIQMISKLSIKRNQEKKLYNEQQNIKQNDNKKDGKTDPTVIITIQNYKRLIEVYCVFMAQRSTHQIIPREVKSDGYSNKNPVNYKQLLQNLKMQNPDNFQSIFRVISIKLGLSEEWNNFIHKKQVEYAQIYQGVSKIVDKKFCLNLKDLPTQSERIQKEAEQQLFDKLTKLIDLESLKFTQIQRRIWEKRQSKRNWLDLSKFLEQFNNQIDTKHISQIVQQLQQNMFKKCLSCISKTIYENGLSTSKSNKIQEISQLKQVKELDSQIGEIIQKLTERPSEKQENLKNIFQLQDKKFQFAIKNLQKSTYFYTGMNPEYQFKRRN